MGAANPTAAAAVVRRLARELGCSGLRIAAVTGDDAIDVVRGGAFTIDDTGEPVAVLGDRLISATVYLGAGPVIEALEQGARVVVTGRVADPSLFLGPLVHEFGWGRDDWAALGRGTLVGHLLECAGQITGGYFADPGVKDVTGLARLGFPLAEVSEDGSAIVTKVPGSGGCVTPATCKEQLLYEIQDPAAYLTPDVVADFSRVRIEEAGPDRVHVSGADGRPQPETLKVSLGYRDGFVGMGEISYAGPGAVARGRLAGAIVAERFRLTGLTPGEVKIDLIGVNALHGDRMAAGAGDPYEVRLRVAARTTSATDATRVGHEVEALYTNGPAGGGGATRSVREVLALASTRISRALVTPRVDVLEA